MSDEVVVTWFWPETTAGHFTFSLASLLHYDGRHGQHVYDMISLSTGPRLAQARNDAIEIYAAKHQDNAEWLLMLDSDMTFQPDLVEALLTAADPVAAPIVGGLCFAGGRSQAPYPTIYRGIEKEGPNGPYANIERVHDYPRDQMVKVQATGGACLLIHRTALGSMKNRYGYDDEGRELVYPWFVEGITGPENEAWGEDVAFCLRANALGIPVWVHTGIKLGHVKSVIIDEVFCDNNRRAQELSAQGLFDGNGFTHPGGSRAERRRRARLGRTTGGREAPASEHRGEVGSPADRASLSAPPTIGPHTSSNMVGD